MEVIMKYLPLLIPVLVLEWALMITAVVHIVKHKSFKFGSMTLWILLVVFIQIIGPILYFTIGRGEDES